MTEQVLGVSEHDPENLSPQIVLDVFVNELSKFLDQNLRGHTDLHSRYANDTPIGLAAIAADNNLTAAQLFSKDGFPLGTVFSTNADQVGEEAAVWTSARFKALGLNGLDDLPERLRGSGAFLVTALGKIARANEAGPDEPPDHSFRSSEALIKDYKPVFAGAVRDVRKNGSSVAVSGLWEVHDQIAAHHLALAMENPELFLGEDNMDNRQELYKSILFNFDIVSDVITETFGKDQKSENLNRDQVSEISLTVQEMYLAEAFALAA